ncbi:transposon Ty3-G Gag-Pol polyprotein, partial [Trichonephila clavata]
LSELVETLSIKFEPLTLVDQQLEPLFKPEQFDGEFEITEEYREKVLLWQFRAKKKINEFLKPRVTSPSLQTTSSQSQDEHFRNSDNIRIKVPKYHITRFYGDDAAKWLTFWNSFETSVHYNESLNKVDKFNYLKAHLGGSALNTVEGFPISAKAYDEAVKLLKNRFANPEILIQAHMNKILSLQPLKNSNDLRSFRKFVDNCNVQLRSLNSLGVSSANYGRILCPMLLKLIPSDLLLDYNKLQQNGSGSDIQLLFLTQSLTAREQTYSMNKSCFELYDCRQETKSNFSREHRSHKQQNQKSFHTACQLLTAPVKENKDKIKLSCIFCESMTHNSNECKYVINLSLEERKNILLRKGACFNCLKVAKHLYRNCPMNKTKCEICSGLHHKFFCFKQQKREIESLSTDLTNQNTGEKITDLWELDSLGIKDPSEKRSKLELQDLALKHFENTILRDDEGRYIVSITWIEGSEKLEDPYSLAKGRLEETVKTLKFTGRLFDYEQVFVDWEKEGTIEKIAQDEPNKWSGNPLTQPCSSVSNGGARLEPRAETSSHQQAETSSMQPCSSVSNGGGGLKLRAETSGHQQAETSSMQPCSSVSDGEAGVEPRVETLELPDDLTSELQQSTPQRSRYGRLLKLRKRLNDSC